MQKISSLTIFFPFFNDAGTVQQAIHLAYEVGKQVTNNLEVIAIHGGKSQDSTLKEIKLSKKTHPSLKIVDQTTNEIGYAVIKHGFQAATKDWVFYTDGDLQYDVHQLTHLVRAQLETDADVVNGYKVNRGDHSHRLVLGKIYQHLSKALFQLPIRDVDCDFRLIRRSLLTQITLEATHAAILPELLYKLAEKKATFVEIPVTHHKRIYGKSNYKWWQLAREKIVGDTQLYFKLKSFKQTQEKNQS